MSFIWFYLVLLGITGFYRVLLGFTEFTFLCLQKAGHIPSSMATSPLALTGFFFTEFLVFFFGFRFKRPRSKYPARSRPIKSTVCGRVSGRPFRPSNPEDAT